MQKKMWRENPWTTNLREGDLEGTPQEQLEAVHVGRAEMSGLFVGQSQNIRKEPCEMASTGGCPLLPRKLKGVMMMMMMMMMMMTTTILGDFPKE